VLAGSDFCPNAVCQLGDHILTFQGHPEFVNGYSRAIMDFAARLSARTSTRQGSRPCEEQPEVERMAGWILRFLKAPELARKLTASYQLPVLGMEAQGSCGARASPACSSSMEMPSGERTKAMCPSRGGRLMVTPPSIRRWQAA
jgi:hypothetical protein